MIDIEQIKPNKALSKYIRKISLFKSRGRIKFNQKLTPSAYTILSYNYKDIPTPIIGGKKGINAQRLQIAGPKTSGDIYVDYNGELSQILVEFSATGFYYLFHKSPGDFTNKIVNLTEFLPGRSIKLFESELLQLSDTYQQINNIENWLLDKSNQALNYCDYIDKGVSILEKSNGHINIAELSSQIFKSERQFGRRFMEIVGISPKHFSKIVQLHQVINLMNKREYGSIQDLSYQANYYDASSFSNKFKELTGFSPSEFVESNEHIALKYFTDLH